MLAGEALGEPKTADGAAEMARVLRVARTSVVRARAKAYVALQSSAGDRARRAARTAGRSVQGSAPASLSAQLLEPDIPVTPTDALTDCDQIPGSALP